MSTIALIGKPNCGKSLLFNQLTDAGQKVANYPGVTVETSRGAYQNHEIIDFPGIYSLDALTEDERVAISRFEEILHNDTLSGVIIVLDGTRLESSLILALQLYKRIESHQSLPVLFAINFLDVLTDNQLSLNVEGLSKTIGIPCILFSAKTGDGLETLKQWISTPTPPVETHLEDDLQSQAAQLTIDFSTDTSPLIEQQNRLDNILMSGVGGIAFFIITLLILFQSIFTWSGPLMDLVEMAITSTGDVVTGQMASGALKSFVNDALFGGLGSFLVFVPQIFVLTFLISLLEDSGYLARMAVICHRPLQWFGLSGKSVIAILTGHACAIPAIYAARTIESPKQRLLTMMAVPLTSCSARLPVYGLLVSVSVPSTVFLGGLIGLQGLVFFGLYFLGIAGALFVSALISKFSLKNTDDTPFMLELPAYRRPSVPVLSKRAMHSAWRFIRDAGWIIFSVNAIIWLLGYFPNGEGALQTSYLASIGQILEPIFQPLGLDWKFTVAIVMSFLAREVFVGALGTMMGLEGLEDDALEDGLVAKLQSTELSLGTSIGLLIFYVFAMQCVSTLAVLKQELGHFKGPVLIFIGYNVLAYVLALGCVWIIG
jgi:ferrous iron transport protein B